MVSCLVVNCQVTERTFPAATAAGAPAREKRALTTAPLTGAFFLATDACLLTSNA